MSADDVNRALQNLEAIRNGQDPRTVQASSAQTVAQSVNTQSVERSDAEKAVADVKHEVMRALTEYPDLKKHISLDQLSFYVAEWQNRRGLCSYNTYTDGNEFGKRVNWDEFDTQPGKHALGIAKRIYEDETDWRGTVRHELAHAVLYEKYGEDQEHNERFERLNERIGGSKNVEKTRENYNYGLSCPEGCFTSGRVRRSAPVKRPWEHKCKYCETAIVSHDWDDDPPETEGVCTVESIDWDTYVDYVNEHGEL